MSEQELDLTGLRCPAPIVKLNGATKTLAPGAVLRVIASDPAFELDVQAWCRRTGNALLGVETQGSTLSARIQKKAD